jgi:hypothetical protein
LSARATARNAVHGALEQGERARLGIAHRQQPVGHEDEGDVGEVRQIAFRLHHQRGGHVGRAAVRVETARRLDVLQLVAGRHLDRQDPLDQRLLVAAGFEQVDPDGAGKRFGDLRIGCYRQSARLAVGTENRDHRRVAPGRTIAHTPDWTPPFSGRPRILRGAT